MEAREGLCDVLSSLDEGLVGIFRSRGGRGRGQLRVERGDLFHGLEETVKEEVNPLLKVLGLREGGLDVVVDGADDGQVARREGVGRSLEDKVEIDVVKVDERLGDARGVLEEQ